MHLNDRPFVPASELGPEADKSCNQESSMSTRKIRRKPLIVASDFAYALGIFTVYTCTYQLNLLTTGRTSTDFPSPRPAVYQVR
jgi:hypothetical protein